MDAERHILRTVDGKVSGTDNTGAIVRALKEEKGKPVVFWFHGGLVDTASGLKTANRVGPKLEEWGQFPIFLVWESGLGHTLQDTIGDLVARKLGRRTVDLVKAMVELKLGDRRLGIAVEKDGGLEFTELDERLLREAVAADPELKKEAQALSGQKPAAFALEAGVADERTEKANERLQTALRSYVPGEVDKAFGMGPVWLLAIGGFVVEVARRTLARFRRRRDHGVSQTILEEAVRGLSIGADLWEQMKKDAEANFAPGGAGRAMLRSMKSALKGRTVILAGHSTGAIMIHHLLDAARDEGLEGPFHLRFLAPAIRYDLAQKTISNHKDLIGSMRIFNMSDEAERADKLLEGLPVVGQNPWVQGIYKGSLLYMVSGAFESRSGDPLGDVPLLGMQRFVDGAFLDEDEAASVRAVTQSVGTPPNAFVWTPTGKDAPVGFRGLSRSHSGFNEDVDLVDGGSVASLIVV